MLNAEEQELLRELAHKAWIERGKPAGSPELDWEHAKRLLSEHQQHAKHVLDDAIRVVKADISTAVIDRQPDRTC